MIAIVDYDAGNLRSVEKAFDHLGADTVVTREPRVILGADKVVLPGVGAFGDAMGKLSDFGLVDVLHQVVADGIPLLGICVGLQVMFESSEESPGVAGLGILRGHILRLPPKENHKIPHMGWNNLDIAPGKRLLRGIRPGPYVYFVHSYYPKADDPGIVAATAQYTATIDAAVEMGGVFATQFHPEKSGEVGLEILRNFLELDA
ncbi:MAG: imidazole glycerol phosphate synthase subunit HisH [Lachnospiraceae bacterium]|jgi:glutamine amidotransferase|nr:imidazole glycerol phosphate synthase subunit HisH [Lachnospiraceae bacterium]